MDSNTKKTVHNMTKIWQINVRRVPNIIHLPNGEHTPHMPKAIKFDWNGCPNMNHHCTIDPHKLSFQWSAKWGVRYETLAASGGGGERRAAIWSAYWESNGQMESPSMETTVSEVQAPPISKGWALPRPRQAAAVNSPAAKLRCAAKSEE